MPCARRSTWSRMALVMMQSQKHDEMTAAYAINQVASIVGSVNFKICLMMMAAIRIFALQLTHQFNGSVQRFCAVDAQVHG